MFENYSLPLFCAKAFMGTQTVVPFLIKKLHYQLPHIRNMNLFLCLVFSSLNLEVLICLVLLLSVSVWLWIITQVTDVETCVFDAQWWNRSDAWRAEEVWPLLPCHHGVLEHGWLLHCHCCHRLHCQDMGCQHLQTAPYSESKCTAVVLWLLDNGSGTCQLYANCFKVSV